MTTIGFIGFGNMAQAIARGWLESKTLSGGQIVASAANYEKLEKNAAKLGITALRNNLEVCEKSDVVILAVKPHILEQALQGCASVLKDKLIINLAVNKNYEETEALAPGSHHISILPNLGVEVGKGVVLAEKKNSLDEKQMELFRQLFEPISTLIFMDTAQFGIGGVLSGCGPAFCALFIEGLADAGVQYGLPRGLAYELALKMAEGSMALMAEKGIHPGVMKDLVCSPGGTTILGVNKLKTLGFEGDLIEAVSAIMNRNR